MPKYGRWSDEIVRIFVVSVDECLCSPSPGQKSIDVSLALSKEKGQKSMVPRSTHTRSLTITAAVQYGSQQIFGPLQLDRREVRCIVQD